MDFSRIETNWKCKTCRVECELKTHQKFKVRPIQCPFVYKFNLEIEFIESDGDD